nr:DUF4178 domain-containing protein [Sulfurovum sp. bin170]
MSGKIDGVEWTIIGWIVYRSKDDASEKWSEFLLFSPLYGYGWLVYEAGAISFSKRVRDFNLQNWEREDTTIFYREGHYLLDDESYFSLIDFVQGELTWVAKRDDKIRCWDYKGASRQVVNIEQSKGETEVYYTKRLKELEVYESFGVESEKQIIPKRSFAEGIDDEMEDGGKGYLYGIIFIALILLGLIISSVTSDRVLHKHISNDSEYPFKVNTTAFLNQITISAPSSSILDSYRLEIYKDKKEIFHIDKKDVHFSKQILGKTWSHTAIGANIYLNLESGGYILKVKKLDKMATKSIEVTIEERIVRTSYTFPLFIATIIFLIYIMFRKIKLRYLIPFGLMAGGVIFSISEFVSIGFFLLVFILIFMRGD